MPPADVKPWSNLASGGEPARPELEMSDQDVVAGSNDRRSSKSPADGERPECHGVIWTGPEVSGPIRES